MNNVFDEIEAKQLAHADERTATLIKHLEDRLKKVEAERWLKLAEASAKALYKFCPNCGHSLNA